MAGFYRLRDGSHSFTAARLSERDQEIALQFFPRSLEGTTATTDELDLGTDWNDDGGGRRTTVAGLFLTPRGSDQIDPAPVRAIA